MSTNPWIAALGGGLVGAALTAGIVIAAGPQLMGERIVRDSLTEHPDILIDASQALRSQQAQPVLDNYRVQMETAYASSAKGASAEDADVVMVEFYDYACGFCRQTKPDIERLIEEDPGLRVVYREWPVLGPDSIIAARASLAASKAGKFAEFHDTLFEAGRPNEQTITAALEQVGLDLSALDDPSFDQEIQQNYDMAGALGGTGTPLFVIGDTIIPQAEGYASYKAAIEKAREDG